MKKAIRELLKLNIKSRNDLMMAKRKIAKKYGIKILRNSEILRELNTVGIGHALFLRRILRKRAIRTMSGIAPVAVLTKPYPCPGKCAYCPTEKNVPQSYLSNEPAVMRAIRCNYDPYLQMQMRLRALEANGHEPTKIELIVIGGTWSVLPEKYKHWFISECFRGANEFNNKIPNLKSQIPNKSQITNSKPQINKLKRQLSKEQKKNEKAKYKIVGLTLETRPDYISEKELLEMRGLGCTRVEIGVQAIDDKILKLNKRGHGVDEITQATKLLKNYGFKITYHIMPGLPGTTPAKDLKMFKQIFKDERFQPDQIKFYPTVVTKGSLLYKWWKQEKYKPYSDKILRKLIVDCKKIVPPYVRIIRLIRDIPSESIIAGNMITNLRQIMKDKGVKCNCIRCRECRNEALPHSTRPTLRKIQYNASGGEEYFISYESKDGKILYGFCRLRLPQDTKCPIGHLVSTRLQSTAIIRELHIYGELVPVGKNKKIQHAGLGKKLMAEAEKIVRKNGYKKIAVISGIGVRGYYRKLGYRLKDSYMVKNFKDNLT
ncbi:tRNA uridine(34) 5-carboxymethylaminomethyl modification radical SAM/GNAT enzyme Elp3 [Candidatus Parcubacteria bacterium]|nr:tRNA uridine(34) 5-carboxymethylaminomethyl modification radical SAM/GNAT enzyme Elp3 [Candidatus Parcubacteria bacterium]